jgi:CheY-like chemotaxis protein
MAHMLIIDDDDATRHYLRDLLEHEGHLVVESANGHDGLALMQSAVGRLIVLLDYLMPNFNGFDVLLAARANPALVRHHAIIIMTSLQYVIPIELAYLMTVADIPLLRKPFDVAELFEYVRDAEERLADDM